MYDKVSKIDDLLRGDHSYLEQGDDCYFLGEYTARGGFSASPTNNEILNLKKSIERRGMSDWQYKERAIQIFAREIRRHLDYQMVTFVPVPPSKARTDPLYDDRLVRLLRSIGPDADVRELVVLRQSLEASHLRSNRPSPTELFQAMEIDESQVGPPLKDHVVVFDDVLTAGAHFKAVKCHLQLRFPSTRPIGFFIARTIRTATFSLDIFGPIA